MVRAVLSLLLGGLFCAGLMAQVKVPFVGCRADGQVGPKAAPKGQPVLVPVSAREGAQLAYYRSELGSAVLAPRGWNCFEIYGSSGEGLVVSPTTSSFSSSEGLRGPAIVISHRYGGTSGRWTVAEMIARVFPAHRRFVTEVSEGFGTPRSEFPEGPSPADSLKYRSDSTVVFRTPGGTEGLGTTSWLRKNADPIDGVAKLVGDTPDLIHLTVRLPDSLRWLAPAIIREVERR